MNTIWKYTLLLTDVQEISTPFSAEFLTAQMQDDCITVWANVNTTAPRQIRRFHIVGTGNPMPAESVRYVGTVQHHGVVWHIHVSKVA